MYIKKLTWNFLDSNLYLLEEDGHLLAIDFIDNKMAIQECREASSVTILLTHEHFDHICGLNKLRNAVPCQVIASETCSKKIQGNKANMSLYAETMAELARKQCPQYLVPFVCQKADIIFDKSFAFHWMGHSVECFSTPGHSAGSSCFLIDDMLFVGDTILENKLMVKFPGSSKKIFKEITVPLLESLLARVKVVYPGHGDAMLPEVAMEIIKSV